MIIEAAKLIVLSCAIVLFLARRQHHAIFALMGVAIGTEATSIRVMANIHILHLIGLIYLPASVALLPQVIRVRSGRYLLYSFAILAVLGVLYGYLIPWPDKTGMRSWTQQAGGRSLIYLVRTLAEISTVIYIAQRLREGMRVRRIFQYLLLGTTLAAAGVLLELILKVDLFSILAPGVREWDLVSTGRLRGLNGEPRTSGYICTLGILILLSLELRPWIRLPLLLLHGIGALLTASTSAFILLGVGFVSIVYWRRGRNSGRLVVGLALTLLGVLFLAPASMQHQWERFVKPRFEQRLDVIDHESPTENTNDAIASSLEVFDASALLFLWDNPRHLILGTGPGLVSLPASDYIPRGRARAIYGNRIDSVPHMGSIRLLSDSGIIGLLIWFMMVVSCFRSLRHLSQQDGEWREAYVLFGVMCGVFMLQVKPVWFVFLGLGIGSTLRWQKLQVSRQRLSAHLLRRDSARIISSPEARR